MKEDLLILKIKDLEKNILNLLFKDFYSINFTTTQARIVHFILNSKDKVYQKDLEKYLNLTRATTSGVLKTMEKHGLIEKLPNISDARSKQIVLKPKTKDIFIKSKEKLHEVEYILTKELSKGDIELFSEIINKMNRNIKLYELNERR